MTTPPLPDPTREPATAATTIGLLAKVRLRQVWFEAHPNQPIPEGRQQVETLFAALFAAIEASARAASEARVAELEAAIRFYLSREYPRGTGHPADANAAHLERALLAPPEPEARNAG